jgi:AcrR family transcriptional regulator
VREAARIELARSTGTVAVLGKASRHHERRLDHDESLPALRHMNGPTQSRQYSCQVSDAAPAAGNAQVARRSLTVEQRRAEILDATRRVVLARGFGHTRIADVATELGVSTGLIHYHFASKDALLAETLRVSAADDIRRLEESVAGEGNPIERLDRVLREYLPSAERDQSWVLWVDAWGDALRNERLRAISEELDVAWARVLEQVIREGVRVGRLASDDPGASAWRLACLMDGLGVQLTLHTATMTHDAMLSHVRSVAARELGFDRSLLPD